MRVKLGESGKGWGQQDWAGDPMKSRARRSAEVEVRQSKDSGCQPRYKLGDPVPGSSRNREHWAGAP